MSQRVRTAVIPVAGLGTRFLPATKSIPKEMLPIVDKPTIQYVVEEAFNSGIETVVFVNGHHKSAIENHFDFAYELDDTLERRGKDALLALSRAPASLGNIVSVRQQLPLGLGHAVLAAYPVVGDQPFAVLLGDDLIRPAGERPGIGQLMDAYTATGLSQVALMTVPRSEIHKYGAAEGAVDKAHPERFHVSGLVEKPPLGTEKTDQAVVGRYVFSPSIWGYLKDQTAGAGGEIQLTDAMERLRADEGLMGLKFAGERVDAGDKLGYLRANLLEAMSRPEMHDSVVALMKELTNS